jgi:hypothetical protein
MMALMRRSAWLLGVPLASLACFSSSAAPQPDGATPPAPDTGVEPDAPFDAPPAEAAPTREASVDAPTGDATVPAQVDASPEAEAGLAPVVVTVVGGSGPEPGVLVAFDDPNGAFLSVATTDTLGRVSQVLAPGSSFTALLGDPGTYASLYTVLGVQPGDALSVVDWGALPSFYEQSRTGCVSVTLPSVPPAPDGGSFFLANVGPCSTQFPPASTLPLGGDDCAGFYTGPGAGPSGCVGVGAGGQAAFPALVQAFDTNDEPIGYLFDRSVALAASADGGDSLQNVAASGPWLTSMTHQTLSIVNDYDGSPGFSPILSEAVAGTLTPAPTNITPGPTFVTHPSYADFVQAEATYSVYYRSALAIAKSLPAPTADGTIPIDVSPLASMPVLSSVMAAAGVGGAPVVSWTTDSGSLSTVTGVIAFASWNGTADGDGGAQSGTWTIVAPAGDQTQIQAPALGGAASAWMPGSGADYGNGNVVVWGVQGSALPDYAAVRATGSAFPETPTCNITAPIIPALPGLNQTLMVTLISGAPCS